MFTCTLLFKDVARACETFVTVNAPRREGNYWRFDLGTEVVYVASSLVARMVVRRNRA